jgi:hypothetical protein
MHHGHDPHGGRKRDVQDRERKIFEQRTADGDVTDLFEDRIAHGMLGYQRLDCAKLSTSNVA